MRKSMMRNRAALACLTALSLFIAAAPMYAQQTPEQSAEAQQLFQLTNQARARHGLSALTWSPSLADAAATHLSRMIQEPNLSHDYPGEPPLPARAAAAGVRFETVAENIAMGYSVPAIQNEWMHSPTHRANILNPQLNALGVAIQERKGYYYAVEDFATTVMHRSSSQAEQQVDQLLQQIGVVPSGPHAAAEAACAPGFRLRSGTHVRLLVHFDTPDLNQLPPQVASEIRSGGYRQAAVALCPSGTSQPDFTTYRFAILLY